MASYGGRTVFYVVVMQTHRVRLGLLHKVQYCATPVTDFFTYCIGEVNAVDMTVGE